MPHTSGRSRPLPVVRIVTATALLTLGACVGAESNGADGRTPIQQWIDPGSACLFPRDPKDADLDPEAVFVNFDSSGVPSVELEADAPLTVRVYAQKPCSMDVELRCSATLKVPEDTDAGAAFENPAVVITSIMEGYDDGTTACPRDVEFVSADCHTPPLPANIYLLEYGEAGQGVVEVPSVGQVRCADDLGLQPVNGELDDFAP